MHIVQHRIHVLLTIIRHYERLLHQWIVDSGVTLFKRVATLDQDGWYKKGIVIIKLEINILYLFLKTEGLQKNLKDYLGANFTVLFVLKSCNIWRTIFFNRLNSFPHKICEKKLVLYCWILYAICYWYCHFTYLRLSLKQTNWPWKKCHKKWLGSI